MGKNLICIGVMSIILGIISPPPAHCAPSIWNEVGRSRRQIPLATPTVSEENSDDKDGTEPQRAAIDDKEKLNCQAVDEFRSSCKADSCPIDDKTLDKCCICWQSCCSSEQNASSSDEGMGSNPNSTAVLNLNATASDAKNKLKDAAGKVQGFFKDVGQNIKQGVNSGWDKVKTTTNTMKESGINTGADWVRNKTSSGDEPMCNNDANCTSIGNSTEHHETSTVAENTRQSRAVVEHHSKRENGNNNKNMANTVLRNKRDVPPGMMAMRNKKTGEYDMESTITPEMTTYGRRSIRSVAGDKTTTSSTVNLKESTTSSRSKRQPAGPPSNSKNMRTTTVQPSDNSNKDRKRKAASHKKQPTKPPQITTTFRGESGETSSPNEDSATTPSSRKGTKVKIVVSTASGQPRHVVSNSRSSPRVDLIPIRAPGSLNANDFSTSRSNSSDALEKSQLGTSLLETSATAVALNVTQSKPGLCRPLSQGLQCVTLGKDAAQCKDDLGCKGSKKCCFYSCSPNTDIGVCEHPIFS